MLHWEKREQFAEEIISKGKDFVNNLVLSDEKGFKLDSPDGFTYYWLDVKDEHSHVGAGITLLRSIFEMRKLKFNFLTTT